jgi:amino acid transporter
MGQNYPLFAWDYQSPADRLKRILLGPALRTNQPAPRWTKRLAFCLLSSGAIAATAYTTEGILGVLAMANPAGRHMAFPLATAIVGLLTLVGVVSYRAVDATPSIGSVYTLARDHIGSGAAAAAAAALLVAFALIAAVSASAAAAAVASVIPNTLQRPSVALALVLLLAWINLRGIRPMTDAHLAIGTYLYIAVTSLVVLRGVYRLVAGDLAEAGHPAIATGRVGTATGIVFIAAATAATPLIATIATIPDATSFLRRPATRNAKVVLLVTVAMVAVLFIGITYLATHLEIHPYTDGDPTMLAQITRQVFGTTLIGGIALWVTQSATLFILVVAGSMSMLGFSRFGARAAGDKLLPRQLQTFGHRLAYSNAIVLCTLVVAFFVLVSGAEVPRLVRLTSATILITFTLAQANLTRHNWRSRKPRRRTGLLASAASCAAGCVALVALAVANVWETAFAAATITLLALALSWTQRRYLRLNLREAIELTVEVSQRLAPPKPRNEVIVPVKELDQTTIAALQYARQLNPLNMTALHIAVDPDQSRELGRLWARMHLPIPLEIIDSPDHDFQSTLLEEIGKRIRPDTEISLVMPSRPRPRRGFWSRRLRPDRTAPDAWRKLSLAGANVTFAPFSSSYDIHGDRQILTPLKSRHKVVPIHLRLAPSKPRHEVVRVSHRLAPPKPRHEVVVLIEELDKASIQALQYARQLGPSMLIAMHIAVDPDRSRELARLWAQVHIPISLEIVDCPDRNLPSTLVEAVGERMRPDTEVSVVMSERRLAGFWDRRLRDDRTPLDAWRALSWMHMGITIIPLELGKQQLLGRGRPSEILLSSVGDQFFESVSVADIPIDSRTTWPAP